MPSHLRILEILDTKILLIVFGTHDDLAGSLILVRLGDRNCDTRGNITGPMFKAVRRQPAFTYSVRNHPRARASHVPTATARMGQGRSQLRKAPKRQDSPTGGKHDNPR